MVRLRLNKSYGFTLLEVLIALVILSLGIAAMWVASQRAITTQQYLDDKTLGQLCANNVLTQIQLGELAITNRYPKQRGTMEQLGRTFYWRATLKPDKLDLSQPLDIEIRLTENGNVIASLETQHWKSDET